MLSVVFDMDGVIFDTEALCLRAWKKCSSAYGISDISGVFEQCIGCNQELARQIFRDHFGEDFPTEKFLKEGRDTMLRLEKEEGIPMKPGVRELLQYLKDCGARVGLASSTNHALIKEELQETGLLDYFQVIVGGDQIKRSKPDPEIYLLACEKLGVEPGETYAIEDSHNGIRSAARAGMKPIMVPDLLAATEEMKGLAVQVLPDLFAVREFFGRI